MNWASRRERCFPEPLGIFLLLSIFMATQLWSQENSSQSQQPSTSVPAQAVALSNSGAILLKEATPVKLKLLHALNSKTVVKDDPLNFALAEDLVVDGKVVARADSAAIGYVRQARGARTLGRGAQLALEMQYLKVNRTRVPLRGTEARAGENKKGETVTLVVLFGLSGLIKHGAEIEVKEGTLFSAYVDRDTEVPALSESENQVQ